MAATKSLHTPKGVLNYPWLNKPDTKFGKSEFKAGLVFANVAAAKEVIDAAKEVAAEEFGAKAKTVHLPVKKQEDGSVLLRTHTTSKPQISNAKGEIIEKTLKIGGGSIAKLSVTMKAFDNGGKKGVTCYLNGVQLLKLVEYTGGAKPFGDASDEVDEPFIDAPATAFADESADADADADEDEASSASDF